MACSSSSFFPLSACAMHGPSPPAWRRACRGRGPSRRSARRLPPATRAAGRLDSPVARSEDLRTSRQPRRSFSRPAASRPGTSARRRRCRDPSACPSSRRAALSDATLRRRTCAPCTRCGLSPGPIARRRAPSPPPRRAARREVQRRAHGARQTIQRAAAPGQRLLDAVHARDEAQELRVVRGVGRRAVVVRGGGEHLVLAARVGAEHKRAIIRFTCASAYASGRHAGLELGARRREPPELATYRVAHGVRARVTKARVLRERRIEDAAPDFADFGALAFGRCIHRRARRALVPGCSPRTAGAPPCTRRARRPARTRRRARPRHRLRFVPEPYARGFREPARSTSSCASSSFAIPNRSA